MGLCCHAVLQGFHRPCKFRTWNNFSLNTYLISFSVNRNFKGSKMHYSSPLFVFCTRNNGPLLLPVKFSSTFLLFIYFFFYLFLRKRQKEVCTHVTPKLSYRHQLITDCWDRTFSKMTGEISSHTLHMHKAYFRFWS